MNSSISIPEGNLFPGDSEMAQRMRLFDWGKSGVGEADGWPPNLRLAVEIMLESHDPMFIWWGRDLITLYNDGCVPLLGGRHPAALGEPASRIWSEVWNISGISAQFPHGEPHVQAIDEAKARGLACEAALRVLSHQGTNFPAALIYLPDSSTSVLRLDLLASQIAVAFALSGRERSARGATEAQMRRSEEHFRQYFDLGLIGMAITSPDKGILEVNDHLCRILGYSREEMLQLDWLMVTHPEDVDASLALFNRVMAGEMDGYQVEKRWIRKDGAVIDTTVSVKCVRTKTGAVDYFVSLLEDVTERKRTEAALRESEQRFRRTFECNMIPMGIWSKDGAVSGANDAFLEMLGYTRADLSSGKLNWSEITPSEQRYLDTRALAEIKEKGVSAPYEKEYVHKDGHRVPVLLGCANFGSGTDTGIFVAADLTERERAQKALETELADAQRLSEISTRLIPEGDITTLLSEIVDAAISISRAEMGTLQLFDAGRAELHLLASRGFEHAYVERFQRVSMRDVGLMAEENQRLGVRASQSTRLVSRSGHPVGVMKIYWRRPYEPPERELRLLDLVARQAADLIERHQAQTEREELLERERQAREEAERAAKAKDQFLATLSHELRTPLNAIIGWGQLIRNEDTDPELLRKGLEVIDRNARAQAQLIADLLDLSRITTGKMRLEIREIDISAITKAAVSSVLPSAEARKINLQSILEPIGQPLYGDPVRLQQILGNLLSNAVKFTPEGGQVRVVLASCGTRVEIRVSDTGQGIKPDFLPHVFERFRQQDPSMSREQGGLGIGLALVKDLAELHGGEVLAASDGPGKGSMFTLRLPFAIPYSGAANGSSYRERSNVVASKSEPDLAGLAVLVIEDEPDAMEVIRRILEKRHAHVVAVRTADEALAALERRKFDLLLGDIGLPKRDGYDLMSEIRKRGFTTPAAAVTAFARGEDRVRALSVGYQAHVTKPLEASELLATVAALVGRPGMVHRPACADSC